MQIFKEESGKWSAKRVLGIAGGVLCLCVFVALYFREAAQISDTLLIGMFSASVALIGVGTFKKTTNPSTPPPPPPK